MDRQTVYETIKREANALNGELCAMRRDFHKYAETGWFEVRTSSILARKLSEMGYEVLVGADVCRKESRMGVPDEETLQVQYERALAQGADREFAEKMKGGMTGVIAILRCGEGPVVGMRFDIDALGVFESDSDEHLPAREGFASVNPGFMHACGHDGHASIGFGVARVLMDLKDELHGTIKLIFQPAEEGVRGAKAIVDNGHLDDVDFFLGSHVTDEAIAGDGSAIYPGCHGSLATTKYDVIFRGQAAHAGGEPHAGKNALLAACAAVTNLYAIPRHGEGASRINVGTLHAGSGRNVVADEAKMELEVRGETTAINDYMSEYAKRVIEGAALMHGVSCEIRLMGAASSMQSSAALMQRVRRVCTDDLHIRVADKDSMHAGGSEDVAYMVNRVQERGGQATFLRLLTSETTGHHSRNFDYGEKVLSLGVEVFCGVVYDILGGEKR